MTDTMEKLIAYKKVAQPTRLKIILTIRKYGPRKGITFNRLRRHLKLNSSTLDHHLKELVSANLLKNDWKPPKKLGTRARREISRRLAGTVISPPAIKKDVPTIIEKTIPRRSYSYYRLTTPCRALLRELDLNDSPKIEETLCELDREKDFLDKNPIF